MAESVSESIKINATPEEVMAVIADFESYPEWAKGVQVAEVTEVLGATGARPVILVGDATRGDRLAQGDRGRARRGRVSGVGCEARE